MRAGVASEEVTVNPEEVPMEAGLLVALLLYLRRRFRFLNRFCVICDQPHLFTSFNMVKPMVRLVYLFLYR